MGVKLVPPMPPRFVIVNVPPRISSMPSLAVRAFSASDCTSAAMSRTLFLSASLITGTTSPRSVSTAMPMWKYFFRISSLLFMS
jgi:hypothetical protein